ncbi:uncharacterized protein LOC143250693 [Tachypleus tridentatus]|uniref:uncharacterized protein LOC143250693 n=1 Tax=Tachypleus tridentatus TaxID=6853 RepID=UPI003FD533C8
MLSFVKTALLLWISNIIVASTYEADTTVLFAEPLADIAEEELLFRFQCQPSEASVYQYQAFSDLWGQIGEIKVTANLVVRCLGYDDMNNYGKKGLKYLIYASGIDVEIHPEGQIRDGQQEPPIGNNTDENPLVPYELPFEIVQLADGAIPEIRFIEQDIDENSRNFKRHLASIISTRTQQIDSDFERSVLGDHNIHFSQEAYQQSGTQHNLIHKTFRDEDIMKLGGARVDFNDVHDIDLSSNEMQDFVNGRLYSADGFISVSMLSGNDDSTARQRRNVDSEMNDYFLVNATYTLKLIKRISVNLVDEVVKAQEKQNYQSASLVAEVSRESAIQEHLQKMKEKLRSPKETLKELFTLKGEKFTDLGEKIQQVLEMEGQLPRAMTSKEWIKIVRQVLPRRVLQSSCHKQMSSKCLMYLKMLVLAGGPSSEKVIFDEMVKTKTDEDSYRQIVTLLGFIKTPSGNFIKKLLAHYKEVKNNQPDLAPPLLETLGTVASKSGETHLVLALLKILRSELEKYGKGCHINEDLATVFRSFGYLGHPSMINDILSFTEKCAGQPIIPVMTAYALRHVFHENQVQQWLLHTFKNSKDEEKKIILRVYNKQMKALPLADSKGLSSLKQSFSEFDRYLADNLMASNSVTEYIKEVYDWMSLKQSPKASQVIRLAQRKFKFPKKKDIGRRSKRAWTSKNCERWTPGNRYEIIQNDYEFMEDLIRYKRKGHCLAYKQIGPSKVNGRFYAAFFGGMKDEDKNLPDYKMFVKLAGQGRFFSKEFEAGSLMFSLYNGNSHFSLKILEYTLADILRHGCQGNDKLYSNHFHIPLLNFYILIVKLSVGINLDPRQAININCQDSSYVIKPQAFLRVGGEAMGRILTVKAGINIGMTLNYYLKSNIEPVPSLCYDFKHGFDPMEIGVEAWYQRWGFHGFIPSWGSVRVWRPRTVTWKIGRGAEYTWRTKTCILPPEDVSKYHSNETLSTVT